MKNFLNKIKLPLSIILSAVFIIGVAGTFTAIYSGRETAIYEVKESVSIPENHTVTVAEVAGEDSSLPDYFKSLYADSITTATCRKYNEYRIQTEDCTVMIRQYNYAYLTEDEPVVIPDDAIQKITDDTEVFIFAIPDGSQALYYKGLTRYIVSTRMSEEELENLFN